MNKHVLSTLALTTILLPLFMMGENAPEANLSAADKFMILQKSLEAACAMYQQALLQFEKCIQESPSDASCKPPFALVRENGEEFAAAHKKLESWYATTPWLEQWGAYFYGPNQDLKKRIEAQFADEMMIECECLHLASRISAGKKTTIFFTKQLTEARKKYEQCATPPLTATEVNSPITPGEIERQFTIYNKCRLEMEALAQAYGISETKESGAAPTK